MSFFLKSKTNSPWPLPSHTHLPLHHKAFYWSHNKKSISMGWESFFLPKIQLEILYNSTLLDFHISDVFAWCLSMFVEAGPFLLDWNCFAANVNSGLSLAFCSAMDSNMIDIYQLCWSGVFGWKRYILRMKWHPTIFTKWICMHSVF